MELVLTRMVPVAAALYATGDYAGWWDILSGRAALIRCLERLASGEGYPKGWIYDDDPDFRRLSAFLSERTVNPKLRTVLEEGHLPTLISHDGSSVTEAKVPEDWPLFRFVPGSAPILVAFGIRREGPDPQKGKLTWACTIDELRRWIDAHRQTERFLVQTTLISVLAVLVAALYTS